jgi:hypothetical protein
LLDRIGAILSGVMCVVLVMPPRALLSLSADFEKFVSYFFDAPSSPRGLLVPDEISLAAIRSIAFLVERRTGKTAVIVRPCAFA